MRGLMLAAAAAVVLSFGFAASHASAADDPPAKADAAKGKDGDKKSDIELPPFPDAASVKQVTHVAGKTLTYTATVGALPVRDEKGKKIAEVVVTSYVLDGPRDPNRPVTFAFNGGPGAASVYLNLGAIGPKRVQFGTANDAASDAPRLVDNAGTWLDFTDMVFIDPIGVGYSRSHLDEQGTKKAFLEPEADFHSIAEVIAQWLRLNGRSLSPKYLIGESYGGYRVPRIAEYLQSDVGIGISGITMVSPWLDPAALTSQDALSPLSWMVRLPSMAASVKERRGETLNAETMAPIETFARTTFVDDFFAGQQDKAATDRISDQVAQYLGLDPKLVRRLDGRVPVEVFVRESRRDEGKVGSVYELNQAAYDPFPERNRTEDNDPNLGATAAFAEAMVDIINTQVGWTVNALYYINNFTIARAFDHDASDKNDAPVTDLRKAVANDPHMSVLIAHGYNDLVCPYFLSKLLVRQMPDFGVSERIKVEVYPGGHMFYGRPDSAAAFKRDAMQAYGVKQ
jgi:carboxypeptidase C (cathepsin A)